VDGERRAAFAQFWRGFNSGFYDPNMHGRDWMAIRKRYEPLLSSVGHPSEFAIVLNMMTGELESSHSEVSGQGTPGGPNVAIDWSYNGPGLKVQEVPYDAPGSFDKTKISAGEIVLQINGVDVGPNMALYRDVLSGQNGRDMTFLVSPDGTRTAAREVKYRAMSSGAFRSVYYDNLIRARRQYVEEKSGGKLTYVHISGMGGGNLAAFNREFWEFVLGKEGVVIDVRDNGGGNIADSLVDMIERKPHAYYQSRDGVAATAPGRDVTLEIIVMHNETSYSNAEMFPAAMKSRGLATLVGVPTPGYVIWTSGFRLVDGTSARMPNSASYRLDGTPMENMGQAPDVLVDLTREEFLAGKDPQLDKAIEVLMEKLGR
jgi:C-terminal processing protease CtpA/Prc